MTWRRVNTEYTKQRLLRERSEHVSQTDQKESIRTHWLCAGRQFPILQWNVLPFHWFHHPPPTTHRHKQFDDEEPTGNARCWALTLAALSEKSIRPESESPFRLGYIGTAATACEFVLKVNVKYKSLQPPAKPIGLHYVFNSCWTWAQVSFIWCLPILVR